MGGSNQTLPVTETTVVYGTQINITYTGTYKDIKCLYGISEDYGNLESINNNICTFTGNPNTKYYYKMIASNDDGKIYESSGNITTSEGTNIVLNDLPTGVKAIIYLDPTNLSAVCNAANSVSTDGTKTGCMKWYAFKEDEASFTMILDHNTSSSYWDGSAKMSYICATAGTMLSNSINSLTTSFGWVVTPSSITKSLLSEITGKSLTSYKDSVSLDGYEWLSGNYWTSDFAVRNTPVDDDDYTEEAYAYGVVNLNFSSYGYCRGDHAYGGADLYERGVRPVITVQKSSL